MPLFFAICFDLGAILFTGFLFEKEPNIMFLYFQVIRNGSS